MPRGERQVPSIYFGRPGALVALPWPRGDMDKQYERLTFDFASGAGQHTIQSMTHGSRAHSLNWNALHIDNFILLSQYWEGSMGLGPWALIDPSVPNLLLPNQASAGNATYDLTGWKIDDVTSASGTLFISANAGGSAFQHRTGGQRSIRWQFTVTPSTTPVLYLTTPYRNWYGIPVKDGLPYTFSAWARPDGSVDTSIQCAAKVAWYGPTGSLLSTSSGGDITMTTWTKLSVTANAPAGAAFAVPRLVAIGSTINVGASIYVDELVFEQDSVANVWAPGTGSRAVEITSLTDRVTFETRMRTGVTMTLREVAI